MFNREYDKALWLMLYSNKRMRREIIRFVKDILFVLGNEIRRAITAYEDYKMVNATLDDESMEICSTQQIETDDGYVYWYDLCLENGTLTLGRGIKDEVDYVSDFQISLQPAVSFEYMVAKNFDCVSIGEVEYDYQEELIDGEKCLLDSNSTENALIKTPFGALMVCTSYEGSRRITSYRGIDTRKVPINYSLDDLRDTRRLNKLMRVKNEKRY